MRAPKALVGSPFSSAVQRTSAALASFVRQMPPPAAATHSRQPWAGLPQLGSIASAVTRPEVIESLRVSVVGAGAEPGGGPRDGHPAPTLARAARSRAPLRNCEALRRVGSARVSRVALRTA